MLKYEDLIIVGIGASAGGFEAFQKFLPKLPQNKNISYVIAQHLDPRQPTLFGELLSKYSSFKITPIENGRKIESNHIYYCPPNKDITIKNGVFSLSEPESKSYPKPSINKFLSSLALEKKEKAIGIILSGTGSDGANGMADIVKYGGIALTEDEGAKYYSMPKAAIDSTKVLASLPPELLAEGLAEVIEDRKFFDKHFEIQDSTNKIFDILNKKTDIDFSSYKEATITRRIKKRMNETRANGVDTYLKILEDDDEEVEKLKDELLIIVTSFFRDNEAFYELEKHILKLVKDKLESTIRIWIPGCATGEEAYTIAIILCEVFEKLEFTKKVTIFATDISDKTIQESRNRYYSIDQVYGIDKKYLKKYFEFKNNMYKPNKILRDMIVFSKHDLIKDPPFLNLDLVSCRNLLIYFDTELQKRVLSIFYYALKYNSILFLGKSETVGNLSSLFSTIHNKYKIYKKSNDMGQINIDTLSYIKKTNLVRNTSKKESDKVKVLDVDLSINKAISNKYAQDGIVVDALNFNVLFYKGDCKNYVVHPQGIQTNDVFKIIVDYLKLDLRATLNEAKKNKIFVSSKKIRVMPIAEPKEYITINVFPLEKNKLGEETFFITFTKEVDNSRSLYKDKFDPILSDNKELNILEDELTTLKERLQITIEELETSNEELQSTNEELQSTNEELQSTNEELETSNEELQSTNEELQTVNDELSFTNLELEFANKAFNNVLANLDAYVMILDKKLNIIKHTDGIIKFFDITKSITTNFSSVLLNSTIHLPNLLEDIKECLQNDKEIGYDIEYNNRNYYFSVKKIDISADKVNNLEEGIVLSFVDRTVITKKDQLLFHQSKMASMGEMIGNIAHQWRQPLNTLSLLNTELALKYEENILKENDIKDFRIKSNRIIQKMSDTIDDFRNYFRPNKQKERFDVVKSLEESLHFIEDVYAKHKIIIKNNIDKELYINGYKNELSQVFLNIFNNSKDAIKENGIKEALVVIDSIDDKKNIIVTITDNGGGIKDEISSSIFEPYTTTKFKSDGTGIGLYMSKMIVEAMRGTLNISNNNDGVKVIITLPKEVGDE